MIDPELVAKIRLLFFAEHWKIGTIATQLNLHRDTVRAALETDRFNRPKQDRSSRKTDPNVDFIRQTLAQYPRLCSTRIFQLIGLRWDDVLDGYLTIDERCLRGDWAASKSEASNATIPANAAVIERIHRLKILTVEVKAGCATRRYKLVKTDGPDDLVFQSVRKGVAMRDNNILSRHIKPPGRKLGLGFLNWRCFRTSHATWLKMAGADVKDALAQMRHSRASTTLDIYQQFTPESQRRVVDKLTSLTTSKAPKMGR